MSGGDDVTVVWVEPSRDDAARALEQWGRARSVRLVAAADGSSSAAIRVDFTVADRVEKELDRAREAIAALEADSAERALARAEALLRDHPELPQAAWLRAEVHRGWAARFTRVEPRDDQRAQLAWQEADALDGGRATGIGEIAFPARAHTTATLTVHGASNRKVITRLDGVELAGARAAADGVTSYELDTAPAEHHVVVSVEGETVFASWIAIAAATAGAPPLTIPIHVADDGACSAASLSGASREGSTMRAAGVACDRWVAAVPADRRGAVLVARCQRSACGAFVEWRSEGGFESGAGKPVIPHEGRWPAWATWTAVGVGALAVTTVVLFAAGVFEKRPTEERFVAGGVRVE